MTGRVDLSVREAENGQIVLFRRGVVVKNMKRIAQFRESTGDQMRKAGWNNEC